MDNLRPSEMDSPLNRKVRAFLAVGPPPEEWFDALDAWLIPLRRRLENFGGRIKWTHWEGHHITLRFFGSISQSDLLEIEEYAKAVAEPFEPMKLDSLGLVFFPFLAPPQTCHEFAQARIMALKFTDQTAQIEALEKNLRTGLAQYGEHPESRPYQPHLTLARLAAGQEQLRVLYDHWREGGAPNLPTWTVNQITLYESNPEPTGSVYTPLAVFPLGSN